LEEIHDGIGKMQTITGKESKFEHMLYKYHQALRGKTGNPLSKQSWAVQNLD
jgi:hypothetical protein